MFLIPLLYTLFYGFFAAQNIASDGDGMAAMVNVAVGAPGSMVGDPVVSRNWNRRFHAASR